MDEHEPVRRLGPVEVSESQRDELRRAAELAEQLADDARGKRIAFDAMARVILGAVDLAELTAKRRRAVEAERDARTALYAAIVWLWQDGHPKLPLSQATGVSRTTIDLLVSRVEQETEGEQ